MTSESSNIDGLTVTALDEASTTVQVASDTTRIKGAITSFITEYNKSQSLIDSLTASSTYDFGTHQSLANSLVLTRMGSDLQVSLGLTYNAIVNTFGVTFEIVPNLLPANRRLPSPSVEMEPLLPCRGTALRCALFFSKTSQCLEERIFHRQIGEGYFEVS